MTIIPLLLFQRTRPAEVYDHFVTFSTAGSVHPLNTMLGVSWSLGQWVSEMLNERPYNYHQAVSLVDKWRMSLLLTSSQVYNDHWSIFSRKAPKPRSFFYTLSAQLFIMPLSAAGFCLDLYRREAEAQLKQHCNYKFPFPTPSTCLYCRSFVSDCCIIMSSAHLPLIVIFR